MKNEIIWKDGFAPVSDDKSVVLILGSFPSVKSREVGFYYGNKRNRFWKTVSDIFGETLPETVEEKIVFLHKHHIALWDVGIKSSIGGSADSDINEHTVILSDIKGFVENHKSIKLIICNGKKAYELFLTAYKNCSIKSVCLPSTSPANVAFKYDKWEKALKPLVFER